jgi:hypothetical protein
MVNEISRALQIVVGLVLAAAAVGKLRDPGAAAAGAIGYQVVPRQVARGAGLILGPLEAVLALSHLTGVLLLPASIVTLVLFAVFLTVLSVVLRRGDLVPCHCFGVNDGPVSKQTVVRTSLLFVAELLVLTRPGLALWEWPLFSPVAGSLEDFVLVATAAAVCFGAGVWIVQAGALRMLIARCETCGGPTAWLE